MMARLTVDYLDDKFAVEVDAAEVSLSILCDRPGLEAFVARATELLGWPQEDRASLHSHAIRRPA
jgi:hypothetical protein